VIKKYVEVIKISVLHTKCVYINHYLFEYQFSSFFCMMYYHILLIFIDNQM